LYACWSPDVTTYNFTLPSDSAKFKQRIFLVVVCAHNEYHSLPSASCHLISHPLHLSLLHLSLLHLSLLHLSLLHLSLLHLSLLHLSLLHLSLLHLSSLHLSSLQRHW
jgi:hypothetical protein